MKNNQLKLSGWLVGALCFTMAIGAVAENRVTRSPLDGRTFVGETGSKGKKADGPDTLTFANGLFRSSACDSYGFGEAPYVTSLVKDGVRFEATTKSTLHGKIVWSGVIRGDQLEGTFVWKPRLGKAKPYWVRASLDAKN